MRSRGDGPTLALPIVLVVTTAIAFLPVRARLGWQRDLARIVNVPLQPLTFGGLKAADFLTPDPPAMGEPVDEARAEVLLDELKDRDRLIAALQGENARLRERLAQFTGMAGLGSDSGRRAIYREVIPVSQQPQANGLMRLLLREQRPGEVLPYPAMIVDPRRLIVLGQVTPGEMRGREILVRPVTSGPVGRIRATVHPPTGTAAERRATAERLAARRQRAGQPAGAETGPDGLELPASATVIANVLLEPDDARAVWYADLGEDDRVEVGDRVRIDEDTWPDATRGYELGRVIAVEPKERSPFGTRITVEPEVRLSDRPSMMYLADRPESWDAADAANAAAGEGGRP